MFDHAGWASDYLQVTNLPDHSGLAQNNKHKTEPITGGGGGREVLGPDKRFVEDTASRIAHVISPLR